MDEHSHQSADAITEADIDSAHASKAKQAECPHHRFRVRCDGCGASLPRPEPGTAAALDEALARSVKSSRTVRSVESASLATTMLLREVAEAARVLQQNIGRQTGLMWSRLDRAMADLDRSTDRAKVERPNPCPKCGAVVNPVQPKATEAERALEHFLSGAPMKDFEG